MKIRKWLCLALVFTLCLLSPVSLLSCDNSETPPLNAEGAEPSAKLEMHEYRAVLYLRYNAHEALGDVEFHKSKNIVSFPYYHKRVDSNTSRDDFPETIALTVQGVAYAAKKAEYKESVSLSQGEIARSVDYTLLDHAGNLGGTLKIASDGKISIFPSVNSDDEKTLAEGEYIDIAKQELLAQGLHAEDYNVSVCLADPTAFKTCVYFSRGEDTNRKDAPYFTIPNYDVCFTFAGGIIRSITYNMPNILQVEPPQPVAFDYERAKAAVDAWIDQKSERRDMNVYNIRFEALATESPIVRVIICCEIDSDHGYVNDTFCLYLFPVDKDGVPVFAREGG